MNLSKLQAGYWQIRRFVLKTIVPEFVWPKEVDIDGVKIKVRGTPYSFGTKTILKSGAYEVAERKILNEIIQKGDIIIEMGGSIGVLTSILANITGNQGKVFSVEASLMITSYSKRWLEEKGNILVLEGFGFPVFEIPEYLTVSSFMSQKGLWEAPFHLK